MWQLMGRLNEPAFIGGVTLGMMASNFLYFGLGFLRKRLTALVPRCKAPGQILPIANLLMRGVSAALGLGGLFWPAGQSALGNIMKAVYSLAQSFGCPLHNCN